MRNFIFWIGLLTLALPENLDAQNTYVKTIGHPNYSGNPTCLVANSDGGYTIGASSSSSGGPMSVLKLTKAGDTIWTRIYDASAGVNPQSMLQTNDGGYVISGLISGGIFGGIDMLLLKIDSIGDVSWSKAYGGSQWDAAHSVIQTPDTGYVIAGYTASLGAGDRDVYIVRTNSVGDTLWTKVYGGPDEDLARSIQMTLDGGFIVTGGTSSLGPGITNVFLMKLDSNGNELWTKTYGDTLEWGYSVISLPDSGFIILAFTQSFGPAGPCSPWPSCPNSYIIRTDKDGDTLWTKTYGGVSSEYYTENSLASCTDKGFVITGVTFSFGQGGDLYLIKIDSLGNLEWSKTYGGSDYERSYAVIEASDQGYVVVGGSGSYGPGSMLIVKTDLYGEVGCESLNPATQESSTSTIVGSISMDQTSGGLVGNYTVVPIGASTEDSVLCYSCFSIYFAWDSIGCYGSCDASVAASASGGVAPYSYSWSNGDTVSISDSICTSVLLTVTDSTGCSVSKTFTVPTPLNTFVLDTSLVTCGQCDGDIAANFTGGSQPYSYVWSTGDSTQMITNQCVGIYDVTITDSMNCVFIDSSILEFNSNGLQILLSPTVNATCGTTADGIGNAVGVGGTSPYTYLWDDLGAQTTSSATGLSPGIYVVTLWDSVGCMVSRTVDIDHDGPDLSFGISNGCDGYCNGSVTAYAGGGASPFTYSWLPNMGNSATINYLCAGTYQVTVTDGNGCFDSGSASVIVHPQSDFTVSLIDPSCGNNCDVSATTTVSNGTPPFWYSIPALGISINPSYDTSITYDSLCNSGYTVVVSDSFGCLDTVIFTVSNSTAFTMSTYSFTNLVCGVNNGTYDVSLSGGVPPFTLFLDSVTSVSGTTAMNLAPGIYNPYILDSVGCDTLILPSFTLTMESGPSGINLSATSVSCAGGSDATASVSFTAGTQPFTYIWEDVGGALPDDSTNVAGLTAGQISVTIVDSNGCALSDSVQISEPAWIQDLGTSSICDYDSLYLQGAWQSSGGMYLDTFIAANGCDSLYTTTLSVDQSYSIADASVDICPGDSAMIYGVYQNFPGTYYDSLNAVSGCDSVHSTDLTYNSVYSISNADETICNGDSVSIFGNYVLSAGTYYDSSTTVGGCDSISATTVIVLSSYSSSTVDVNICEGDSVMIFGVYQKVQGTFYDSVTATNGCDSIVSTELIVLSVSSVSFSGLDTSYCIGDVGFTDTLIGNPVGGTFSGPGMIGNVFDPFSTGFGTFTITYNYTDGNGCEDLTAQTVEVTNCSSIGEVQSAWKVRVYPNPTTGIFNIELEGIMDTDLELRIFNSLGQEVAQPSCANDNGKRRSEVDLREYPVGVYTIRILSGSGIITRQIIVE